jgi:hypothetical protein
VLIPESKDPSQNNFILFLTPWDAHMIFIFIWRHQLWINNSVRYRTRCIQSLFMVDITFERARIARLIILVIYILFPWCLQFQCTIFRQLAWHILSWINLRNTAIGSFTFSMKNHTCLLFSHSSIYTLWM